MLSRNAISRAGEGLPSSAASFPARNLPRGSCLQRPQDSVEIAPEGGISNQKVDEIKVALRELGGSDDVELS
jgi:hypothetical protein